MNRKIAFALLLASAGACADDIALEPPASDARGSRTREEVASEYMAARDEVRALTGEDSGSAFLSAREPARVETQMAGSASQPAAAAEPAR